MTMHWIMTNCVNSVLNEELERYTIKKHLESAEIMPHGIDMAYSPERWFIRLEAWGKINLYYKEPTTGIGRIFTGRKKITQDQFLKKLTNINLNRLFGTWTAVKAGDTKMFFERDFIDIDQKRKKEFLYVEIDLRPELKNAFK